MNDRVLQSTSLGIHINELSDSRESWRDGVASSLRAVLVSIIAIIAFSANAQVSSENGGFSDAWVETEYPVDVLYHIDDNGTVWNLTTGEIEHPLVAAYKLGPAAAIVVGIIVGGGSGAIAARMQGGSASQVFFAGFFGGVAGYYGALATMGGVVGILLYGPASVGAGGAMTTLVTASPPGSGGCVPVADHMNCLIKPK